MTTRPSRIAPAAVVVALALVRLVLLAHPRPFRRQFGGEILADLTRDIRESAAQGAGACVRVAVRATLDAITALRAPRGCAAKKTERRMGWLRDAQSDVWLALRGFKRDPAFSVSVIVTLALGIGLNAAMFGVVDRLMLRGPEHVRDVDRVRRIQIAVQPPGREVNRAGWFGFVAYDALKRGAQSYDAIAAYSVSEDGVVLGRGIDARRINRGESTASLFPLLGVSPALGRFYSEQDDDLAAPQPVVVIGYTLWQRDFAGRDDVIGKTVLLDNTPYTVIGVAPKGFTGPDLVRVDVWMPESLLGRRVVTQTAPGVTVGWTQSWNASWLSLVVRLKPGVSDDRADAEATAVYRAAYTGRDAAQANATLAMRPLQTLRDGTESLESRVSLWLLAVAGIVLAIACANVVNLVIAHGFRRQREMAVRLALGAGRSRLLRLLVVEGMTLAAIGGAMGVAVAYGVGALLRSRLAGIEWPDSPVNLQVLAACAGVSLAAGVVVGLLPAIGASKPEVSQSLKTGAREGGGRRGRVRGALTVVQAALSALLLVGSGLFVTSLERVRTTDLGLQPDRVLTVQVRRPGVGAIADTVERQREQARRLAFYPLALDRLKVRPDIEAASLAIGLPFSSGFGEDIRVPGLEKIPQLKGGGPFLSAVTADYFKTVGTRIIRGRAFTTDDRAGSMPVAIVNETMARTLWPNDDAMGKCFHVSQWPACLEIVGIAANTRQFKLREDESMAFYLPFGQEQSIGGTQLLIRPRGDTQQALATVRQALIALDPTITFVSATVLQDRVDPQVRPWVMGAAMFSLMGVLALIVAAIGLYSVMAYLVTHRTHEIGVRMALGASPADVVRLVLRGGLALAAAGVVVGLGLARLASGFVEPLLFDTSPYEPVVFIGVAFTLLVMAALAGLVPATRARRVNPVEAMRVE